MAGEIKAGMSYGTVVGKMQEMLARASKNGGKVNDSGRNEYKDATVLRRYTETDKKGNEVSSLVVNCWNDKREADQVVYTYNGLTYYADIKNGKVSKIHTIQGNGLEAYDKNGDGKVQQDEINFIA